MIEEPVVDVAKYADRAFSGAVEGNLSEIVGKTKAGLVQIGRYQRALVSFPLIAVQVSAHGLPKCRVQYVPFLSDRYRGSATSFDSRQATLLWHRFDLPFHLVF